MAFTPYTTKEAVRSEAGFDGNQNIKDPDISAYLVRAHAETLSHVGAIYNLTKLAENFEGSQAEAYLKRAEELISAGYLLIREYGREALDTDSDGYAKKKEGIDMLLALQKDARLLDSNNEEYEKISVSTAGGIVASGAEEGENIFAVDDVY